MENKPIGGCDCKCNDCSCRNEYKTDYKSDGANSAYPSPNTPTARLLQWPCQIRLVPTAAPYFDGTDLVVSGDCCAFAYGGFHAELMRGRITLIGCPKLDGKEHTERLTEIIALNDIKSVTVIRMEVYCCAETELAVRRAIEASGKRIPCNVITVSTNGKILEQDT